MDFFEIIKVYINIYIIYVDIYIYIVIYISIQPRIYIYISKAFNKNPSLNLQEVI